MSLLAPKSNCPPCDPKRTIYEFCGRGYREKRTHAWCVPVWVTIWTNYPKWMFWKWQVTEFISKENHEPQSHTEERRV